jgi:hypothetical protein
MTFYFISILRFYKIKILNYIIKNNCNIFFKNGLGLRVHGFRIINPLPEPNHFGFEQVGSD